MVKVNGMSLEEADTEEIKRIREEIGEMLDNDEGTDGDAFVYVELGHELMRRGELE